MSAEFGQEMKRLRQARGLTQQEFADQLGTKQGRVSALEQGVRGPGVETLYRIAEVLGVSTDHFKPYFSGKRD